MRGLKYQKLGYIQLPKYVAPHTGAWIEIRNMIASYLLLKVAPHTGAWIEMTEVKRNEDGQIVAPHTGAWIEMIP